MSNANTFDPGASVLTVKPQGRMFAVAYNGRVLGDDRSYPTVAECEAEITARIERDHRDARRYDRPVMLTR
jgi:hypothetical protein